MNSSTMFMPVVISLAVIFLTIITHGLATVWGVKVLVRKSSNPTMKLKTALYLISFSAVFLMVLHFIEIAIWAVVFLVISDIQELANFEEAIYFAMITYTTVGYGDITLDTHWRIMSGFVAMDGIVLFGWTTALLYAVVQRILLKINPNS